MVISWLECVSLRCSLFIVNSFGNCFFWPVLFLVVGFLVGQIDWSVVGFTRLSLILLLIWQVLFDHSLNCKKQRLDHVVSDNGQWWHILTQLCVSTNTTTASVFAWGCELATVFFLLFSEIFFSLFKSSSFLNLSIVLGKSFFSEVALIILIEFNFIEDFLVLNGGNSKEGV